MSVNISYESEEQLDIKDIDKIIESVVEEALESEKCPYEAEVNIILAEENDIQEINKEFREIDQATDVLSFPALEYEIPGDFESMKEEFEENGDIYFNPDTGELMLGDMMLSVPRVISQAEEYGHSLKRELAFLVAHSMFHLMGYDHMTDEEAEIMEKKQENVLEKLGITRS